MQLSSVTLGHGVHFLTTCTARKSRAPGPEFRLRNAASFDDWRARIGDCDDQQLLAARDLYQGDNARQALDCPECWGEERIESRVISAGLGLLSWDANIPAYSATFQRGDADSVSRMEPERTWWNRFGGVAELAQKSPRRPILIAASEVYVQAMHDDLLAARDALQNPADLLILSVGSSKLGDLSPNLLPVGASLQPAVGGVLAALNTRLANWLLRQDPADPHGALARLRAGIGAPEPAAPRAPRTDTEIAAFIRRHPSIDRTPMIRKLRDAGYACGQDRFGRIYETVFP